MSGPLYPNVPAGDGVPSVRRDASNSFSSPEPQLTKDSEGVTKLASTQWGVFNTNGRSALQPDNIVAVGYDGEYRVADYPIEKGGFESYDKVALPFDVRLRMTKGGLLAERQQFLAAIDRVRADLNLYNVVTPEATYLNVNCVRVRLDRDATSGAGLLGVEMDFREIRQNATLAFSKARDSASADPANGGAVQAQPTSASPDEVQ